MQKAKNSNVGSETVEITETPSEGLPAREALEVALQEIQEKDNGAEAPVDSSRTDTGRENVSAADAGTEAPKEERKGFEPPAEWTAEEKADFVASSPKAQEAALRLHRARQAKIEEIKRGKEELAREQAEIQWARDIASQMTPFLKARGEKEPAHAQLMKALKVVNDIDSNTKAALIEIARAKNLPVPKEWESDDSPAPVDSVVLERVSKIESMIAESQKAAFTQQLSQAWSAFEQEQNAAGSRRFPDINESESGLALARNIGSLVRGDTELSKQFIATVQERIPGANYQTLLTEAYRYYGGRIDDSQKPAETQTTHQQIIRAKRASSSVPGGSSRGVSNGTVKRFKSYRDALSAAAADLTE